MATEIIQKYKLSNGTKTLNLKKKNINKLVTECHELVQNMFHFSN
jgi:hypothetical protein